MTLTRIYNIRYIKKWRKIANTKIGIKGNKKSLNLMINRQEIKNRLKLIKIRYKMMNIHKKIYPYIHSLENNLLG